MVVLTLWIGSSNDIFQECVLWCNQTSASAGHFCKLYSISFNSVHWKSNEETVRSYVAGCSMLHVYWRTQKHPRILQTYKSTKRSFFRLSFPLNNRWLVVVVGEINSESANKLWCKSHVSIVSLYSCTVAFEPYMRRVDNMKQMLVNKKIVRNRQNYFFTSRAPLT